MPTTINIDMAKWTGTDTTGPLTLVCDGATPEDDSAGGAVMRMIRAQMSNDLEGMAKLVTPETMAMGNPSLPGKHVAVSVGAVTTEGETWVVPAKVTADGQEQPLDFVVVKQEGNWKVDMPATLKRLMGEGMEQLNELMEQGMQQMADGMAAAMEGVSKVMSEALGATAIPADEDDNDRPAHPALAAFRQSVAELIGVRWKVTLNGDTFDHCNPELIKDVLDELLVGVEELARGGEADVARLAAVERLELSKQYGWKDISRLGRSLTYVVGETDDGRADFYDRRSVAKPLAKALDGILD